MNNLKEPKIQTIGMTDGDGSPIILELSVLSGRYSTGHTIQNIKWRDMVKKLDKKYSYLENPKCKFVKNFVLDGVDCIHILINNHDEYILYEKIEEAELKDNNNFPIKLKIFGVSNNRILQVEWYYTSVRKSTGSGYVYSLIGTDDLEIKDITFKEFIYNNEGDEGVRLSVGSKDFDVKNTDIVTEETQSVAIHRLMQNEGYNLIRNLKDVNVKDELELWFQMLEGLRLLNVLKTTGVLNLATEIDLLKNKLTFTEKKLENAVKHIKKMNQIKENMEKEMTTLNTTLTSLQGERDSYRIGLTRKIMETINGYK